MIATATSIAGLLVLEPRVFADERGHFFEAYSQRALAESGVTESFVQMNQSFSKAGVLRGMHFQAPPFAQSKLVRCISGKLFDVAVDLRVGSPTFGQWFGVELSEENKKMLYVPAGFAHGFYALTDCEMLYLCGHSGYNKESEGGLRFDDPAIGIAWPLSGEPNCNERDRTWPLLKELRSPFVA